MYFYECQCMLIFLCMDSCTESGRTKGRTFSIWPQWVSWHYCKWCPDCEGDRDQEYGAYYHSGSSGFKCSGLSPWFALLSWTVISSFCNCVPILCVSILLCQWFLVVASVGGRFLMRQNEVCMMPCVWWDVWSTGVSSLQVQLCSCSS
jgi:hypothetical protein